MTNFSGIEKGGSTSLYFIQFTLCQSVSILISLMKIPRFILQSRKVLSAINEPTCNDVRDFSLSF